MSVRLGSPRIWSTAFGALAVLSFAAAIPLSVLSDQTANLLIAAVIGLPSAGIGVLVTRRQPGNPLGWLFLVSATCQFIGTDGGGYALRRCSIPSGGGCSTPWTGGSTGPGTTPSGW
ncbi:MAG TPA: hypothetical protein VGS06_29750 [Streptosporangiaceae bacterium]|nr:hypothetical protein [Streptosporangiaceae bacterium]